MKHFSSGLALMSSLLLGTIALITLAEAPAAAEPVELETGLTEQQLADLPEVFEGEEAACEEGDERPQCQKPQVRTRGIALVPPLIPFRLESVAFPGRCLRPTARDRGARVYLASCARYASRYWTPTGTDRNGFFCLKNNWSKTCLRVRERNGRPEWYMNRCGSSADSCTLREGSKVRMGTEDGYQRQLPGELLVPYGSPYRSHFLHAVSSQSVNLWEPNCIARPQCRWFRRY